MSEHVISLVGLALVVLLLAGMVVAFARRGSWLAPHRDPRVGELVAETRALRERIDALAETQARLLRRLDATDDEVAAP